MAKKIELEVNEKECKKHGITANEAMALIYLSHEVKYKEDFESLCKKGLIAASYKGGEVYSYTLMDVGVDVLDDITVRSSTNEKELTNIEEVISGMQALFPEGKKDGTAQYWRGNKKELKNRLFAFFKKYGEYEKEDILKATEKYVNAFKVQGDFKNMRLLKYFIWKRENKSGEIEESSDLLSFIENDGEEVFVNDDWTSNLRV